MSHFTKIFTLIALLGFAIVFGVDRAEASEKAMTSTIYTVDRTGDSGGLSCTSAPNDCTLRSAIQLANATPGLDTIHFDGLMTITLFSDLPAITEPLWIYGGDTSGYHDVYINGASTNTVFEIQADDVWIEHVSMRGGNGSDDTMIAITGSAQGTRIYNSVLGGSFTYFPCTQKLGENGIAVDSIGATPSGARAWIYNNTIRCVGNRGVMLWADEVIVGADPNGNPAGNLIADSDYGLSIASADDNTVRDNTIEDNITGVTLASTAYNHFYGNTIEDNSSSGVYLFDDSSYNTFGCLFGGPYGAEYGNKIRGNGGFGIIIVGSNSQWNDIFCNTIGLNDDGTASGNVDGVKFLSGPHNNYVGFNDTLGNVISGNSGNGVTISNANDNVVAGTMIGTSADGVTVRANGAAGVRIENVAYDNIVGGNFSTSRNVISGNGGSGVLVDNADTNTVAGNHIGMSLDGLEMVGNGGSGIEIRNGSAENEIGSDTTNEGFNLIGGNALHGIHLSSAGSYNNISWNYVGENLIDGSWSNFSNGGHAIFADVSPRTLVGTDSCNIYTNPCLQVRQDDGIGILINQSGFSAIGRSVLSDFNDIGIEIRDSGFMGVYPHSASFNDSVGVAVTGISYAITVEPKFVAHNQSSFLPFDLNMDGATSNESARRLPASGRSGGVPLRVLGGSCQCHLARRW